MTLHAPQETVTSLLAKDICITCAPMALGPGTTGAARCPKCPVLCTALARAGRQLQLTVPLPCQIRDRWRIHATEFTTSYFAVHCKHKWQELMPGLYADEWPWGQTRGTMQAAQNPFVHTPLARALGRQQLEVPLQHAPPQFQAWVLPSQVFTRTLCLHSGFLITFSATQENFWGTSLNQGHFDAWAGYQQSQSQLV